MSAEAYFKKAMEDAANDVSFQQSIIFFPPFCSEHKHYYLKIYVNGLYKVNKFMLYLRVHISFSIST